MALLKWNQKLTPLDNEIQQLKLEVISMWQMVLSQLQKAEEALKNLDRDLAREVILTEKRVNAFELKIDRDCEDILALFAPVAIDLRFILAVLKINMNLESESAAHFTDDDENPTNIWQNVDEDESDTPAFLRRRKKNNQNDQES